jgi:hypothetical protein
VSGARVQARDLDGFAREWGKRLSGDLSHYYLRKTTEDGGILQSTQFLARVLTKQVSIGEAAVVPEIAAQVSGR